MADLLTHIWSTLIQKSMSDFHYNGEIRGEFVLKSFHYQSINSRKKPTWGLIESKCSVLWLHWEKEIQYMLYITICIFDLGIFPKFI